MLVGLPRIVPWACRITSPGLPLPLPREWSQSHRRVEVDACKRGDLGSHRPLGLYDYLARPLFPVLYCKLVQLRLEQRHVGS